MQVIIHDSHRQFPAVAIENMLLQHLKIYLCNALGSVKQAMHRKEIFLDKNDGDDPGDQVIISYGVFISVESALAIGAPPEYGSLEIVTADDLSEFVKRENDEKIRPSKLRAISAIKFADLLRKQARKRRGQQSVGNLDEKILREDELQSAKLILGHFQKWHSERRRNHDKTSRPYAQGTKKSKP